MKLAISLLFMLLTHYAIAQNQDTKAIQNTLANQIKAWNKGDLDHFMIGYWQSDSLVFIGKKGITYGYYQTLENYKKNYPDKTHMGLLQFDIQSLKPLGASHYFIIGKWHLKRNIGDLEGQFTLVFEKINGVWTIIADHSS